MITASSHRQPLHDLFRSRPPVRRLLHIQVLRMKSQLMPLGVTVGVCVFCLLCCVVALYLLPGWNVLQSQPSPARSPSSYLCCFCYSLTVFIKQTGWWTTPLFFLGRSLFPNLSEYKICTDKSIKKKMRCLLKWGYFLLKLILLSHKINKTKERGLLAVQQLLSWLPCWLPDRGFCSLAVFCWKP